MPTLMHARDQSLWSLAKATLNPSYRAQCWQKKLTYYRRNFQNDRKAHSPRNPPGKPKSPNNIHVSEQLFSNQKEKIKGNKIRCWSTVNYSNRKTWHLLSHWMRAAYRGKLKSKRIHPQQLWNAINPLQNIYKSKINYNQIIMQKRNRKGGRKKRGCMRPSVILNFIHAMLDINS